MAQRFKLIHQHHTAGSWSPDQLLARALAERDRFLERCPQHRPLQQEIDRLLDQAGNQENRMAVLAVLMESKLIELHGQLQTLNRILLSAQRPAPTPPSKNLAR